MRIKLVAIVLCIALVLSLAGCGTTGVSKEEYDALLAKNESLQKQLDQTTKEKNELKSDFDSLWDAYDELYGAYDELYTAYNSLTQQEDDDAGVGNGEIELPTEFPMEFYYYSSHITITDCTYTWEQAYNGGLILNCEFTGNIEIKPDALSMIRVWFYDKDGYTIGQASVSFRGEKFKTSESWTLPDGTARIEFADIY